ncbi:MAG: ABC transporter substrate-binding protein [Deltaproteobacteria bacterium]|nr:ABC transporter substrate-binding protein [Deltaproteobacteria bacterium]
MSLRHRPTPVGPTPVGPAPSGTVPASVLHAGRALALLTSMSLAACDLVSLEKLFDQGSLSSATAAPTTGGDVRDHEPGTLIVGLTADALGLDPARFTDNESVEVCEQVYEHLVRYAQNSVEIEPALATHWDVAAGGTEWTFHLRSGVRFHDGTPLDAAAVVFSFERQRDPHHPYHTSDFTYWENNYRYIEKIEAQGRMVVKIKTDRPYAPLLALLATFPVSIVSPEAVRLWGEDFKNHPVGTGPFRFVSWSRGDRIVLERNEQYWGRKARLRRLVFRTIPDARQRLIALEGGAVDVAYNLLPEELQFVELHPDLKLHRIAGQNVAYLAMNTMRAPWGDVHVRRAVNHAINKVPIVKLIYQGQGVPATGPLPPTIWSYRDDVARYPFDRERARALLIDAVARKALDRNSKYLFYVPRTTRQYLPNPEQVAAVIQRNLKEVGIETEVVAQDFAAHLEAVRSGRHDLCLLGWAGDNSDPDNFYSLLDKDNTTLGMASNVAFFRNAELHGLLTYARETQDRAERERYYRRAQEIIAREAPWVPLAHAQLAVATREDVAGFAIHPSSLVYYHETWLLR